MLKIIPDWTKKQYRCHFCNETRSVKYEVEIVDPVIDSKPTMFCACNKCALLFANDNEKDKIK